MTTGTSQLATAAAQREAIRSEANAATIAKIAPGIIEAQQRRIAELEAGNAALRDVATAADTLTTAVTLDDIAGNLGPAAPGYEEYFAMVTALATARAAGYLQADSPAPGVWNLYPSPIAAHQAALAEEGRQ
jgi:hypothetical protein